MNPLFSFSGRIGRLHYFFGTLAVNIIAKFFDLLSDYANDPIVALAVVSLPAIACTWVGLALLVKRMRDFGWHWKWIPIALAILLLGVILELVILDYAPITEGWRAFLSIAVYAPGPVMLLGIGIACLSMPGRPVVKLDGVEIDGPNPLGRREPTFSGRYFQPRI